MVAIFFVSLLIAGCAGGPRDEIQSVDGGMAARGLTATQKNLADAQAAIAQLQRQMMDVEKRSKQQAAKLDALQASIEDIRSQLAALRISAPLLPAKGGTRQDLEKKLDQIASSLNASKAELEPPTPAEDEKKTYTAAYLALKAGRFDEASNDFASLLDKYPRGKYADRALYWYGESLYAQHRLKQAAAVFEQLVQYDRTSIKYAAALLRLGSVYEDMNRTGDAVAAFKRLIREHPDPITTENARLALQQITQENKK